MILKLDKGDTQEVFKEFVDVATKEYIDNKIKQLFDQRVEAIIKQRIVKVNLENMIERKIHQVIAEHFKQDWNGKSKHVDEIIKTELKEVDFEKIITNEFSEELLEKLWRKIKFVK